MSPRSIIGAAAATCAVALGLGWPAAVRAQEAVCPLVPEPATRLEAFMARRGVLIVSGSTRLGTVRGEPGSWIAVATKELTDAQGGERASGVAVEVRRAERRDPDRVSYVDLEEMPSLLSGLDAMSRLDPSATALEHFEAHYVTSGGLVFTVFHTSSGLRSAVGSGLAAPITTEIDYGEFQKLRQLLQAAYDSMKVLQRP